MKAAVLTEKERNISILAELPLPDVTFFYLIRRVVKTDGLLKYLTVNSFESMRDFHLLILISCSPVI